MVKETASAPKSRVGKVAAVLSVLMILATLAVLVVVVMSVRNSAPLEIEGIVESVEPAEGGERCLWQLTIEVRNDSDQDVVVERIRAILDRGRKNGMLDQAPALPPGERGTFVVAFRLPDDDCPAVDDINHGNLTFIFEEGSTQSVRF